MANIIQKAQQKQLEQQQPKKSTGVATILNDLLDKDGMRKRFDDLLGKRAPQFISSIIAVVNADANMQRVVAEDPMTIVQAALRAAMYDLPIDNGLGYAWLIPSKNKVKTPDGEVKRWQARMQLGWKGLVQLCIRTGVYQRVPSAVDVREGELVSYDRLTGDAEFAWIEDEDEREKAPIIGYAAYFRLKNGAEATLYMTKKQIEKHEKKYRAGDYMGKGWRDDWDAMAKKTVLTALVKHKGLLSIDYRDGDSTSVALAQAVMEDGEPQYNPNTTDNTIYADFDVDENTGEVVEVTDHDNTM